MDANEPKQVRYSISQQEREKNAVEQTRMANKSWAERRKALQKNVLDKVASKASTEKKSAWRRETHKMHRDEARSFARDYFKKYPRAAYWSEVESWHVCEGDVIEFTLRRLPSAG